MKFSPHIALAHRQWKDFLEKKDGVVDATLGNGHDTAYLASLVPQGWVVGLDIQQKAIDEAQKKTAAFPHVTLLLHDHISFPPLPSPPALIVYNLGYLPSSSHEKKTTRESTLLSLESALALKPRALSITCYSGHAGGEEEERGVISWGENLSSAEFEVRHHRWLNRPKSPSFLWIERREFSPSSHRSPRSNTPFL